MMASAHMAHSQPADRRLVITGFVLATGFSGLVTLVVAFYNTQYQAVRTERAAAADKFVQTAQAMDPIVRRFVADQKMGRVSPKTRADIRDNLLQQMSTLEAARTVASKSSERPIMAYEATLTRADSGIKAAGSPVQSGAFVQEVVHLAEQRPLLFRSLRAPPSVLMD